MDLFIRLRGATLKKGFAPLAKKGSVAQLSLWGFQLLHSPKKGSVAQLSLLGISVASLAKKRLRGATV